MKTLVSLLCLGIALALVAICRSRLLPGRTEPPVEAHIDSKENRAPVPPHSSGTAAAREVSIPLLRELQRALATAKAESDYVLRDERIAAFVDSVALADIPMAVEFLAAENLNDLARAAQLRLLQRWAESDSSAAAEWAVRLPPGEMRHSSIMAVAIIWANQNRQDTIAWVQNLPEDRERSEGLRCIAYEIARTEATEALKLAVELPFNEARDELIRHAAAQWAANAPEAAAAWAKQIGDSTLRESVLSAIATAWSDNAPEQAAKLAVESLTAGRQQEDAVVGVIQRWAQKEPGAAASWVMQFPEGALRQSAFDSLIRLWADQNVEEPGKWLNGLPPGLSRDTAVSAYVSKVLPFLPESAVRWAESIGDDALRSSQIETAATAWLANNRAAATTWIQHAPLPEQIKLHLLRDEVFEGNRPSM